MRAVLKCDAALVARASKTKWKSPHALSHAISTVDFHAKRLHRKRRLDEELHRYGIDPGVLQHGHTLHSFMQPVLPSVRIYLNPDDSDDLVASEIPGRARTVAATVAQVLLRARAEAADELCNNDRAVSRLQGETTEPKLPISLVLDGLSAADVGCLLRTSETAGLQEVVCCGTTPRPPDRNVLKTSLGAEQHIMCRHESSLRLALDKLRSQGHQIVGISDSKDSLEIYRVPFHPPLALVLGSGNKGTTAPDSTSMFDLHCRFSAPNDFATLSTPVVGGIIIYDILRRMTRKRSHLPE